MTNKMYDAEHWILPLSKRVYLIVDQIMNIIYRKDMGFALLPNQTQTLIGEIDRNIRQAQSLRRSSAAIEAFCKEPVAAAGLFGSNVLFCPGLWQPLNWNSPGIRKLPTWSV